MTKDEALRLALEALETLMIERGSIYEKAITAIKAALEAKDEPVKIIAYNCICGRTMKFESEHGVVAPQRTWVGLTDEEIATTSKETHFESKPVTAFARAIEAKLKEKNT